MDFKEDIRRTPRRGAQKKRAKRNEPRLKEPSTGYGWRLPSSIGGPH